MSAVALLLAAGSAALVTSFQLWQDYRRLPFRDEKHKAVLWWSFILLGDAIVAASLAAGLFTIDGLVAVDVGGFLRPVLVGILGPLALRSPVRRARIRGQVREIGITYVYDIYRVVGKTRLDDRIVDLRRVDRRQLVEQLTEKKWDPVSVRGRIEGNVDGLDHLGSWDKREIAEIRRRLRAAMAFEEASRLDGLLSVVQENGLTGLIDGMRREGPGAIDGERGQKATAKDVEVTKSRAAAADIEAQAAESVS